MYQMRRYSDLWSSNNVILLNGTLFMGSDVHYFILTFILINIPAIGYFSTTSYYIDEFGTGGYLILTFKLAIQFFMDLFMIITACMDPGVIPKIYFNNDPHKELLQIPQKHPQKKRRIRQELVVKSHQLPIKFCTTCKIYRPLRSSHCGYCDNCVEHFDHHCPWLGTCIGRRNYRCFFLFVSFLQIFLIYVFSINLHILLKEINLQYEFTNRWGEAFSETLKDYPIQFSLCIFAFVAAIFVATLLVYHIYLLFISQSTNEQLKAGYSKSISGNPFKETFKEYAYKVLYGFQKDSQINLFQTIFVGSKSLQQFKDEETYSNSEYTTQSQIQDLPDEQQQQNNSQTNSQRISLEENQNQESNNQDLQNKNKSQDKVQQKQQSKIHDDLESQTTTLYEKLIISEESQDDSKIVLNQKQKRLDEDFSNDKQQTIELSSYEKNE